MTTLFANRQTVSAHARLLGERLDLRTLENAETLSDLPLTFRVGVSGCAVLFRYGVVVTFGLDAIEEVNLLENLKLLVRDALADDKRESENAELVLDAGEYSNSHGTLHGANGAIRLHDWSVERVQIVADVLAKSTVLSHYEANIAAAFDAIEPLAIDLRDKGRAGRTDREMIRHIGGTILIQHNMVGLVEIGDKPEMLWERADLDRWYARLEDEYELRERSVALERKLDVLSRTAETVLNLLQHRGSLRVEWYIVALIVFEIALIVYDMFGKR